MLKSSVGSKTNVFVPKQLKVKRKEQKSSKNKFLLVYSFFID